MRKVLRILGVLALPALAVATVPARSADERPGHYSMSPAAGGFVRLDTQTGVMSLCKETAGQLACEVLPDGQELQRKEIERLEAENKALRDQVKQLEDTLGLNEGAQPGTPPPSAMQVPTEQDVDKLFDYIEGMVRKFRERIKKLEKDDGKDTEL